MREHRPPTRPRRGAAPSWECDGRPGAAQRNHRRAEGHCDGAAPPQGTREAEATRQGEAERRQPEQRGQPCGAAARAVQQAGGQLSRRVRRRPPAIWTSLSSADSPAGQRNRLLKTRRGPCRRGAGRSLGRQLLNALWPQHAGDTTPQLCASCASRSLPPCSSSTPLEGARSCLEPTAMRSPSRGLLLTHLFGFRLTASSQTMPGAVQTEARRAMRPQTISSCGIGISPTRDPCSAKRRAAH